MVEKPGLKLYVAAWVVMIGLLFAFGLRVGLSSPGGRANLPVISTLPDFTFTNQGNQSISLADLKGNIWIADFIFTTCTGPCPRMSAEMASLRNFYQLHPEIRFVSYTVNPEYDTPEILKKYSSQFGPDNGRWTFLTGDKDAIHQMAADGFRMGSVDEVMNHSTYFALVDREGRVRGYYASGNRGEMQRLKDDIGLLLDRS